MKRPCYLCYVEKTLCALITVLRLTYFLTLFSPSSHPLLTLFSPSSHHLCHRGKKYHPNHSHSPWELVEFMDIAATSPGLIYCSTAFNMWLKYG
ncbi:hypothetical protein ASPVEDRAFT_300031 [Aspergillus versicolor CBS 583.65]|uniref:Uncharacterized protein n=1 Tax=Aspergillus versicolor CBS 583.65 TaxID=1036611 RepID=A0A1L9P7S2_ASPVE|nr:uncharacterized protein ASPVEDRAFT_300031 [Aspergillus versicolor CBS 583.65]OJI97558.1 hypothetical protein ASPVEDRAFT_300031 [Aspergillus versicolor CBS 583.65]